MTGTEYIQLRAFARYDGFKLFILWLISFILYVIGMKVSFLGLMAFMLALATPSMALNTLRSYRDQALGGVISLLRGWAYVVFLFFYASLLFALAQFVYFAFIDKGYFMGQMMQVFSEPATMEAMEQMGMGQSLGQMLANISQMRPIDLVLNILMSNMLIGVVIGLPVALFARRSGKPQQPVQSGGGASERNHRE